MAGGRVGTAVGVSLGPVGRTSGGGVSLVGGGAVAVKMAGVGACGEQETRKCTVTT